MSDIQENSLTDIQSKELQQESFTPENAKNIQKPQTEEPKIFYKLLLTQFVVILISTVLPTKNLFFHSYVKYPRSDTTFDQYCKLYGKCRENYYYYNSNYYQQDSNQFQVWRNAVTEDITEYTCLFYWSLSMFPLLLIFQSLFKNSKFLKQKQRLLYYGQSIFMSLFVQICTHLIQQTKFKQSLNDVRFLLACSIGNISFFYLNQNYFKKQLEFKSSIQKCVNYSFIIICLRGIFDIITVNQSNWIPHILIILYSQIYLLHLNTNLFQENNKYIVHNKSLPCIIKQRLRSLFDVQDVYKEVAETHFVISNKMMYTGIVGSIVLMVLRDLIFSFSNLFVIVAIVSIITFDTSLVSTSSKLTLKDQYYAANLFFLDFSNPIRNVIMELLV